MVEEPKHGSPATSTSARKAGSAVPGRVFKRRIDCAPSQAGDQHTDATMAAPAAPGGANAAGKDRSPPRAL